MKRIRYQHGSVSLDPRSKTWFYRWREDGKRKAKRIGTLTEYPSKSKAVKAAEGMRLSANSDADQLPEVTFNAVAKRYIEEKMPKRFSTAKGYRSYLDNWVIPKWGDLALSEVRPMRVDQWLESLALAGKSKSHIRMVMRRVFESAMLWEYIPVQRNPMDLVRVTGVTKRNREPRILTPEEFSRLLQFIPEEPYRTMVIVCMGLGLRISELIALKWSDFDWLRGEVLIQRGMVSNRVDRVKTIYSKKSLPIHPELATCILRWKELNSMKDSEWCWPSPMKAGERPLHGWKTQQWKLAPAAKKAGLGSLGWHDLRHTYKSWLGQANTPMAIQKDLMRHASITTTMNIYGGSLAEPMREANAKVISVVMDCNRTVQ